MIFPNYIYIFEVKSVIGFNSNVRFWHEAAFELAEVGEKRDFQV
jgi:hypothetical protein